MDKFENGSLFAIEKNGSLTFLGDAKIIQTIFHDKDKYASNRFWNEVDCFTLCGQVRCVEIPDVPQTKEKAPRNKKKPHFRPEDYPRHTAMQCATKEEVQVLHKFLHRRHVPLVLDWSVFKQNTCYEFNFGLYGSRSSFEDRGYRIIQFSDFDWK